VATDVLTDRALNRALLARQLLLDRVDRPVADAVADVVGVQAQEPQNPYVGLWSRLTAFDPAVLSQALVDRQVVRIVVMRGTIHLVTADDALVLRPLAQPVLDGEMARHRDHAPKLAGLDLAPVMAFAEPFLAEQPRTGPQLRAALADEFPDLDAPALGLACRNLLALVQVPPRGLFRRGGPVTLTTAQAWLGRPLDPAPDLDAVVLRYLRAFGPATPADVSTWSRLTGMREVIDRLAPHVRTQTDEHGRTLYDVPDGLLPDPDTPASPRFLPEYDNVLLSHGDRRRVVTDEIKAVITPDDRPPKGWLLVDGFLRGTWSHTEPDDHGRSTLTVPVSGRITKKAAAAIEAEGRRLLKVLTPEATERDVRVLPGSDA